MWYQQLIISPRLIAADCGSSTNDSDDQKRKQPFRDLPAVQRMDNSSNKDSRSERRGEDDVREEESLLTAKKSVSGRGPHPV